MLALKAKSGFKVQVRQQLVDHIFFGDQSPVRSHSSCQVRVPRCLGFTTFQLLSRGGADLRGCDIGWGPEVPWLGAKGLQDVIADANSGPVEVTVIMQVC